MPQPVETKRDTPHAGERGVRCGFEARPLQARPDGNRAAFPRRVEEEPMGDVLSMYSIQRWLESCPQGYLGGTEYGHLPGEHEPDHFVSDATIREHAIGVTVQLVAGERCALAASSGLINAAPDDASKRFLATQTLDEARHVEVFTQRLYDLGVRKAELEDVIRQRVNRNLAKFAEILLERVDKKDFVAGIVGQNIVLESIAFTVLEMMHASNQAVNPKFAHTLSGTIADERRHVGFGENRIGSLIREHPERKREIERMQRDMSYWMLATFADLLRNRPAREGLRALREKVGRVEVPQAKWRGADLGSLEPEAMARLLADTVLKELETRLGRIGLECRTPANP